jgi:acetate kinase
VRLLVLNCGSSSVKYKLFAGDPPRALLDGQVDRIGSPSAPDHRAAIATVFEALADHGPIDAVGHRVVHGGERFRASVIVDEEVEGAIDELAALAPLHNPVNLEGIRSARAALPGVPHCAIFDTAWHETLPERAYRYALPEAWYRDHGVRRYGFHGTSFLYLARRAAALLGRDPHDVDLILFHVGNGASANAVKAGRSVDTSMGMTPLEGLVMGTRCGDVDPAVVTAMMGLEGLDPAELDRTLNRHSGLAGLADGASDRRVLMRMAAEGHAGARLALDVETYRLRKYLGAYLATLGRADAVVFSGGAGEMSPELRSGALEGLHGLGIRLDPERNEAARTRLAENRISADDSPVSVFVVPTDEEQVMAEDTAALLEGREPGALPYSFQRR